MRTSIQRQVQAGQLNPRAADDLHNRVDDIAREINGGHTNEVTKSVEEFRDKLADLLRDGKLSPAGYDELLSKLDQLTGTRPQ
jgi:serine/threonine-protein kinase